MRSLLCVTLRLPRGAIFLDESSSDRRSDYLAGDDKYTVELAEARDQGRKSQGPVGPLRVQRVPSGHRPCKQINGVSNYLCHVNSHSCQDGVHHQALRQREVKIMVARQDVVE